MTYQPIDIVVWLEGMANAREQHKRDEAVGIDIAASEVGHWRSALVAELERLAELHESVAGGTRPGSSPDATAAYVYRHVLSLIRGEAVHSQTPNKGET